MRRPISQVVKQTHSTCGDDRSANNSFHWPATCMKRYWRTTSTDNTAGLRDETPPAGSQTNTVLRHGPWRWWRRLSSRRDRRSIPCSQEDGKIDVAPDEESERERAGARAHTHAHNARTHARTHGTNARLEIQLIQRLSLIRRSSVGERKREPGVV